MTTAKGTFSVTEFDEQAYDEWEGGRKLTRARIVQALTGDIEGEAPAECLMCYREDGTADVIGLQHVTGKLGDRAGSFVFQTTSTFDGTELRGTLHVVPGSGTGDLAGLRGEGTTHAPHGMTGSFTLDYEVA
jgi:hypothetical protein